jgi:transposase
MRSSPAWSSRSPRSFSPNPGSGCSWPPRFIGEIAGIDRFTSDAQLARLAGCAPIPVSSGRTDRHRLDPGGNRRLNSAFYMLAVIRISRDPRTAVYLAKQRANGKTQPEAIRSLKRHLVRRVYHPLHDPRTSQQPFA